MQALQPAFRNTVGVPTMRHADATPDLRSMMPSVAQIGTPIARAASVLRRGGKFILDIALPPLCPSCRAPLGDGVGLCASCWSKLSLIDKPYCARLGIPFTY